jgi:four helix bundle protein
MRVWALIASPHASKDFDFCTQIGKSSRSAPANIGEGFGPNRPTGFRELSSNRDASLKETRNHLIDPPT